MNFAVSSVVHDYNVPWFMYLALVLALVIYALIEVKHTKHDHVIKTKEATVWTIIYIGAALLFAIPIYFFIDPTASGEYLAAWAIEKALSLDNLFVIGLIFVSFKVPPMLERRMLNYGIFGAIFFRLVFILAGYQLLATYAWVSVLFGLILFHAAFSALHKAIKHKSSGEEHHKDITKQRLWRVVTKLLPIHDKFDGHKLITVVNGKRMLTLMAGVIIFIELSDIVFAVDSVPAVLAVSPDRFIAYSSNVFAILGLRALFFVYQSVADKFWALEWGLAGILGWIAFKMMVAPDKLPFNIDWLGMHVPIGLSLSVLAILLFGSIAVSLIFPVKKPDIA